MSTFRHRVEFGECKAAFFSQPTAHNFETEFPDASQDIAEAVYWYLVYTRIDPPDAAIQAANGLRIAHRTFRRVETQHSGLSRSWQRLVFDTDAPIDADGLTPTATAVVQSLLEFGPTAIDLTDLCPESVNGMHLLMVLRCTYSWKNEIKGWDKALVLAREALEKEGLSFQEAGGDLIDEEESLDR